MDMNNLINFLGWFIESNSFIGLATILTGGIVILVFCLNKREERMRAARIILMEIRNIEAAILKIKETGVVNEYTVFPQSSWEKFNHLFAKRMDRDEMDLLDKFFITAKLTKITVERINNFLPLQNEQKAWHIQEKLVDFASKLSAEDYEKEKNKFLEIIHKENYWFLPDDPKEKIITYIRNINLVSGSIAMSKLKKIARIK